MDGICCELSPILSFLLAYKRLFFTYIYLFNMLSSDPPKYIVIAQQFYMYPKFKRFGCTHHLLVYFTEYSSS